MASSLETTRSTAVRGIVSGALREASPAAVGGKAATLLRLRALGFSIPPLVVITTDALEAVLPAGVTLVLAELERERRSEGVGDAADRIASLMRGVACPEGLLHDLRAALAAEGIRGPLAVRSSVVGEDGARHSFAGLMDSVLGVGEAGLADAVVRVWSSTFSARALAYRVKKGLGVRGLRAAVIVQEMVPAASAGVLFTRDVADSGRCRIVAAAGLGEGVVQGTAAADTYRIGRSGRRVEAEPAGPSPVLVSVQVREVRDLGRWLERALGGPQDVEWAFDGEGRLWLLQSRPIVPTGERGREYRVWDNANIVESYPGLTRPLTFSFARQAYETAFREAARRFFPLADPFRDRPHLFKSLIGLLDGRVYYNLLDWYELLSCHADPEGHRQVWDRMIGIAQPHVPPARRPGLAVRVLAAVRAAAILLRVGVTGRRFFRHFAAFLERHQHAAEAPTAAALAARYRALEADAGRFWHLTLFNDLCAMRYHAWLEALCRRWAPAPPDLAHALLAGEEGIESVAPARSLAGLAERVTGRRELKRLFDRSDDRAVWVAIQTEPRFAGFHAAMEAHLRDYGDRGLLELKLETVTFREDPSQLVALVRRYVESGVDLRVTLERERARRRAAEAAAAGAVRGVARRLLFRFVLARARAAVRQRENMRFARARLFGIVRRVFRALGEELAAVGLLAEPGDVFDLTVDEVLGAVEGTAVTRDASALARLRRREYEAHARRRPADRIETEDVPGARDLPEAAPPGPATAVLRGTGCSAGVATGRARVVGDPRTAAVDRGDVLVARSTDPGWVFLMLSASGLVTERGSILSHTAIIGRELGIPTVVGVAGATSHIPDGARLTLDGGTGEVRWV